jgi:hypothetical protein
VETSLPRAPEDRATELEKRQLKTRRKYKVIPKKQMTFLPHEEEFKKEMTVILKLAGYSHRQIGDTIGVTRGTIGAWLREPAVKARVASLMEALPSAARALLQGYSIEAVHSLAWVMRNTEDEKMIIEAAREILDRSGLPKASRQEINAESTHKTELGINSDNLEALRDLPPHLQEEAAAAIEELQETLGKIASRGIKDVGEEENGAGTAEDSGE